MSVINVFDNTPRTFTFDQTYSFEYVNAKIFLVNITGNLVLVSKLYLMRQHGLLLKMFLKDTTELYLHMAKQGQARHTPWKGIQSLRLIAV